MGDLNKGPVYSLNSKNLTTISIGLINTIKKINQPYILDLITRERLVFQNIPNDLKYSPESNFMAVASAGRNNPLYQYVGSEDVLAFTLSWYAEETSKNDVLRKVKWLESLSKNDGYDNKPHLVQCVFGEVFRDAKWIVSSAGPIQFNLFDREIGMFPKLATQEITLKRVTDKNRTRQEILSINS